MLIAAAFLVLVFSYSLLSKRLEGSVVTGPMVFAAGGALLLWLPGTELELAADRATFLLVAEIGLVMTLFTDASRIPLRSLTQNRSLPRRLLTTGMVLTILLGAAAAMALFPGLSWWEAGILAAILAPTDAGLGAIIVNSPRVPPRIRQALNVEAGLNDGLAVPFLMLFIAFAASLQEGASARNLLLRFMVEQIGYGAVVGGGIGLLGGALVGLAQRRDWMSPALAQLGIVVLPLSCLLLSHEAGASMFIAAFAAGLAVQIGYPQVARHSVELTEQWGLLFNFFVFFLFGLLVTGARHELTWRALLYAVLSLTIVRMVPVALALMGSRLSRATVLFMGWFGPRGLASIVLGLVYLELETSLPHEAAIRTAVMATVLLSVFAHGFSAAPWIERYARATAKLGPEAPEMAALDTPADGG
jgi:NhaP-type Na+/H+ or K+/H+ antiporter